MADPIQNIRTLVRDRAETTQTLADEVARLRHGLGLIVRESEQFPNEDGIGAGMMARNILDGR